MENVDAVFAQVLKEVIAASNENHAPMVEFCWCEKAKKRDLLGEILQGKRWVCGYYNYSISAWRLSIDNIEGCRDAGIYLTADGQLFKRVIYVLNDDAPIKEHVVVTKIFPSMSKELSDAASVVGCSLVKAAAALGIDQCKIDAWMELFCPSEFPYFSVSS